MDLPGWQGQYLYQHICHIAVFGRLKNMEILNFSTTILLTFPEMRMLAQRNILEAD